MSRLADVVDEVIREPQSPAMAGLMNVLESLADPQRRLW